MTSGEATLPNAQADHADRAPERVVAEAINNTRRRYALYYLHKQNGPVELPKLVRQVASWENYCQPEEVPVAQRKSVYSALHQTHLPYLEERGLVAFDHETNEVKCQLEDSELDLSLAADPRTTVQWYRVYLLLAAAGGSLLGATWVGVQPFARVPPMVLAGVLVSSYVVSSIVHWYDVYRWRCRMNGMPPDFFISIDHSTVSRAEADEDGT